MNLELKQIEITGVDGKKEKLGFDYKGLANHIFNTTQDLGELEIARELYKNIKNTLAISHIILIGRMYCQLW